MSNESTNKGELARIYLITLILSACSVTYEFVIAHTLSLLAANTVVWYSVIVGVFIVGLGLGALIFDKIFRENASWEMLFWTEIALTVIGGTASLLIHYAHFHHLLYMYGGWSLSARILIFGVALLLGLIVGLLSGLELPLVIKLANQVAQDRKVTNRVLGMDYLGALLGGVSFPLLLLPLCEAHTIGLIIASINLVVAIYILPTYLATSKLLARSVVTILLIFALLLGFFNLPRIEQFVLKRYYYALEESLPWEFLPELSAMPQIDRISSRYQKIDLVQDFVGSSSDILIDAYSTKYLENPEIPLGFCVHLNMDNQYCSTYEEIYHEYFTHVPIILTKRIPERVLVVGGGDGLLIRELLKYEAIKSITHVDLDAVFIETAKTHPIFKMLNQGALDDARVTTKIADGYQYLRQAREVFDAIYFDLPDPSDYNLAKLYSREFYAFAKARLADDGFIALDAVGLSRFSLPDEMQEQIYSHKNSWSIYRDTLHHAGFDEVVPYVSYLEFNNPLVEKIVANTRFELYRKYSQQFQMMGEEERAKREEESKKNMVVKHVLNLQHGFIVAFKQPGLASYEYKDYGITYHVLNPDRFKLAFHLDFPRSERIEKQNINSIFRPKFPDEPLFYTRVP